VSRRNYPFRLRLNGREFDRVKVTRYDGSTQRRVVVVDPLIGRFSLHDGFQIELQHYQAVAGGEQEWRRVSVAQLLGAVSPNSVPDDVCAAPGLNNSDLIETKSFTCNYADEFMDEPESVAPTASADWEHTVRKAEKAFYLVNVPSFVFSREQVASITFIVPDVAAASACLLSMHFDGGGDALQVTDPDTDLTVRLSTGICSEH
jgi:hypothetical protein